MNKFNSAFLILTFVSLAPASLYSEEREYIEDLMLMSAVVPHYKVDKVTLQEAFDELFRLVLPKEGFVVVRLAPEDAGKVLPISLDLTDVPVRQVVVYLADLSNCRWKLWGWPGRPSFEFTRLTEIDDSELFHSVEVFELTEAAALSFGFQQGTSSEAVRNILKGLAVNFPPEAAAFWNQQTRLLAVRNTTEELAVVSGIIRLKNQGFTIQSPAKQ